MDQETFAQGAVVRTPSRTPQAVSVTAFPQVADTLSCVRGEVLHRPLSEKTARAYAWPSRTNKRHKHVRLDSLVIANTEAWCRVNEVPVSELIEQLLRAFLVDQATDAAAARALRFEDLIDRSIDDQCRVVENLEVATTAPPQKAQDEKRESLEAKRSQEILELYRQLSGNRIRAHDRQALKEIFDLPDLLIYAGIMRAVLCSAAPVGSFAYCVKVIKQLEALPIDHLSEFEQLREKLLARARGGQLVLPLSTQKLLFGNFRRTEN